MQKSFETSVDYVESNESHKFNTDRLRRILGIFTKTLKKLENSEEFFISTPVILYTMEIFGSSEHVILIV